VGRETLTQSVGAACTGKSRLNDDAANTFDDIYDITAQCAPLSSPTAGRASHDARYLLLAVTAAALRLITSNVRDISR